MNARSRLILLLCNMLILSIIIGSVFIYILYKTAFDEEKERLVVSAQSQARLIEAVARFDALHSQHDHPEGASAATLSQIVDAHKHYDGFGQTGEFALAKREENRIVFLISHRYHDLDKHEPIPFASKLAEPMRLALMGQSGTIVGLDYRGVEVLAAYEPVALLSFGIVVKIDLSEIQEPFIEAAMIGGGIALALAVFSTLLFFYISEPAITDLKDKNTRLEKEIHVREQAEEERQLLEAQLYQSQKMEALGTLAGGIAHDFNNMLAIILGYANLLTPELPEESGDGRSYLEEILKAGNRSADLVKQILTFSRMDATQRQPLNASLVVVEALQMLRATIPANIEMQQDISENCRNILADKTQIHQVLVNLTTNAFHAMEEGGILKVILKERECEDCSTLNCPIRAAKTVLQITVKDTGHGIPHENMKNIFDPFFTTKKVGKGTGLGLAVVYSIVQKHEGIINIDSDINKGTTIKICFPIIEEKETIHKPTEDSTVEVASRHILLVEDEASLAKMYRKSLERSGYIVTVCTDGSEALSVFQENPNQFDVVLTDQAMPNMTGKQLSQELQKISPNIPIILCTGYSSIISEENADTIGVHTCLMKPVTFTRLRKAIDECLSSS